MYTIVVLLGFILVVVLGFIFTTPDHAAMLADPVLTLDETCHHITDTPPSPVILDLCSALHSSSSICFSCL